MRIGKFQISAVQKDAAGEVPSEESTDGIVYNNPLAESIAEALNSGRGLSSVLRGRGIIAPEVAAQYHVAYRCITLIAGSMARLPVYLEDADGYVVEDFEMLKPAYRRYAETLFSGSLVSGIFYLPDLIKQQATDLALHGNTFMCKLPRGGLEYHPPWGAVDYIDRQSNDQLFAYFHLRTLGKEPKSRQFDRRDLVFARLPRVGGFGSSTGLLGTPPLVAIARPTQLDSEAEDFLSYYFMSGGFGNQGVISLPNRLDADQAVEIESRIHRKRSAGMMRRVFTVLGGGAKFFPLNTDTQSSEMVRTTGRLVEDVARAYGVPGALVGIKTTEVGAGLEELTKIFIRFSLMQYREALETAYSYSLFDNQVKFKFDISAFSAADLKALAQFFTASVGDAQRDQVMTARELRAMVDTPKRREDDAAREAARQTARDMEPGTPEPAPEPD